MAEVADPRLGLSELAWEPSALIALCAATTVALATVAVYSPKYAFGAIAAAAFLALALWRLAFGVAVFAVLTFPEHLPGTLGAGATVAKPLGVVLVLAWIVTVVARPRSSRLMPRDMPAAFWVTCAFLALAAASALWAPDLGQVAYEMGRLLQVAAFFLVVYTAVSTRRDFRTGPTGTACSFAIAASGARGCRIFEATSRKISETSSRPWDAIPVPCLPSGENRIRTFHSS